MLKQKIEQMKPEIWDNTNQFLNQLNENNT